MKMFQSNTYYLTSVKGYIVSIEEIYGVLSLSMEFFLSMEFYLCLWNSIFVYGVLSLSIEFYLCLWLGWVQSMRKLGAKYMDTFGCMSMPFGCMSMDRLGAKYADVGCKVYGDVWVQSICLLGASMIWPIACLIVGSLPDSR